MISNYNNNRIRSKDDNESLSSFSRTLRYDQQSKRSSAVKSTFHVKKSKQMINQYRIIRKIGRGNFAKVSLCLNTETGETHAVK